MDMESKQDIDKIDYNELGNGMFILEDYTGAVAEYTKAITLNPANAELWFTRYNAKKGKCTFYIRILLN